MSVKALIGEVYISFIENAVREDIGTRRIKANVQRETKPWSMPEVKELPEQNKQMYLEHRSSPSEENYKAYAERRNRMIGGNEK
ncbi:hypothetical protein Trydic_g6847 [Trypoxylus dichotomus]